MSDKHRGSNAVIKHVSVIPEHRRHGIGSSLVKFIKTQPISSLSAETDNESVEFYLKLGFDCKLIASKFANVERFMCVLQL